jgi:flagellar biogenesis protein FliO
MDFKKYLSGSNADPKQILKFVLGFAAVMLVLWLLMVSQMDFQGTCSASTPEEQMRADSLRSAITQTDGVPRSRSNASEDDSPNIFFNALTTFLILITILGLVWVWTKSKGGTVKKSPDLFQEIAGQNLGQGSQLKVIEINNEVWVMGVSDGSVNLLHRYGKDEWVGDLETAEADQPIESSFYNMLKGVKA